MTDIMAQEALRTTLAEAFRAEFDRVYGDGRQVDADTIAGAVLDLFPEVEWEFATNSHGVPVRRLAIRGEEVVDLSIVEQAAKREALSKRTTPHPFESDVLGAATCGKMLGSEETAGLELSICDLPVDDPAHEPATEPHLFVPVRYKGQTEAWCGHFTMTRPGEARKCNALAGDPVHATA